MLTILFDGVAYGMILFVLAVGLSVTLGLMNVVNLAHGAFAMAGGYVGVVLVNRIGVPYLAALPLAAVATALIGVVLERTLYVHVYGKSHLDQVLFTIGLVFMASSAVSWTLGSQQVFIELPGFLRQRFEVFGVSMGAYRLLVIVVCGVLAVGLQGLLTRTRFGSRLRAAVDDPVVARGLGIEVGRIFLLTFALGFVEVRQKGSHKQFRHADGRSTTVPFHPGRDLSPILLRQIAKDIGLTVDALLKHR